MLLNEDNAQWPYDNTGLWCQVTNKGRLGWRAVHVTQGDWKHKIDSVKQAAHDDLTKLFARHGYELTVASEYEWSVCCFQPQGVANNG